MTERPADPADEPPEDLLPWPPPGLARIQGDLWIAVRKMGAAGFVLVAPLMVALTLPDAGEGMGPFGDAWWIVIVTTLLGVGLFVDALVMCVRLLTRSRAAIARGYSTRVIALAASDEERTGGYLLQGAHEFSTASPEVRLVLSRVRILSGVLHLASMCWLTIGFGLCLLLSARGALSPAGLAGWTLAPAAILWAGGLLLRAVDGSLTRRARKEWHKHPWSEDLVREEVASWKAGAQERGLSLRVPALRAGWLTGITVALITTSVVGIVPTITLVPASSMGAILSAITGWSFERTARRAASNEAFRRFRLEPNALITPEEAGSILNVLANLGEARRDEGLLPPERTYEGAWFPPNEIDGWAPHVAPLWSDSIWIEADRGLPSDLRDYVAGMADHPAHAELARLASAPSLDMIAGVYERPFSPAVALYDLPFPRLSPIREGANAHLAVAALRSSEGRHEDAIRMAREVISIGFLLQDDSPILIGTLIGSVLVRNGGAALVQALRRAGDEPAAVALRASTDAIERAVAVTHTGESYSSAPGREAYMERARAVAADSTSLRGLRWETAHMAAVIAPCLNVRTIVFGPGEEYNAWLAAVRTGLVRTPAEAEYFEVAARGLLLEGSDSGPMARALAAAMGGGEAPSSCAHVIGTLRSMM
jgi:hypothetical protein